MTSQLPPQRLLLNPDDITRDNLWWQLHEPLDDWLPPTSSGWPKHPRAPQGQLEIPMPLFFLQRQPLNFRGCQWSINHWCYQLKHRMAIRLQENSQRSVAVSTYKRMEPLWQNLHSFFSIFFFCSPAVYRHLSTHMQAQLNMCILSLGWRALKTPTCETPGFGGHVTPLTLQYLWPRPPGVWLGGPGCKPGHNGWS